VTLFFVALGMQIPVPTWEVVGLALAASAFVMVSRLSVVPILYALGLGHRASLLPAINLAQVSEFSIVVASLGFAQKVPQIPPEIVTVVIITFAITAVLSTYMINASHRVQKVLSGGLKRLGIKDLDVAATGEEAREERKETVVFLGFFRDASSVLHEFETDGEDSDAKDFLHKILVIDFNPTVMRELRHRKITCIYGDIAHADTLRHASIENAELVISSITDDILRGTSNLRMLKNVRAACPKARVVLTTEHIPQALHFYEAGADFVYIPRLQSAPMLAHTLKQGLRDGFQAAREAEIEHLKNRHEVLA
jgi:voltage-gated potassium channel Kch